VVKKMSKTNVQFIDLKAQQKHIESEVNRRIAEVLKHGRYILGPEVKELEEKLASFTGVKHAVTCASGTDALLMVLMAQGIGPGDAVFTTPFTFIATAEVIALLGATPVFVDIDPHTYNIDPDKLELAIRAVKANDPSIHPLPNSSQFTAHSSLTAKAVIPVDLFGLPADYDRIMDIAGRDGLFVLADAAQSFGAVYKGRRSGSLGHAAATSFFPAKPLGCYGDGGAVFTNDDGLAEKFASIRVHGKGTDKYDNVRIGLNARLDTIQAAILLAKLEIFEDEIQVRQRVAMTYGSLFTVHGSQLTIPYIPEGVQSAWAQYSLLSDDRDILMAGLKEAGIPTMIYYPKPLHLQSAFEGLGYKEGAFPVSETISKRIFSLPMHPYLTDQEIGTIVKIIAEYH
jgi:dTDP-4-amino-4,6-dideoxygalactose transaminase